ncbi:diacylglycerol kinase family lipid kinase, partial [Streptomyces sp. TRM76130]|nr:diacylglycerol kinase family lipid kinase [Streptomyces sp. TRM76130]
MRALLVVNPAATTTSARTRDVLIHALASEMKLEAVTTEYRGHARDLGRQAAQSEDIELVVA